MTTSKLKIVKKMLDLAKELKKEGSADPSLRESLSAFKTELGLSDSVFDEVINLINRAEIPEEDKLETFSISIWEYEKLENIENTEIRKLCAVLLYFVRTSWHPTGWIRYDENKVMSFCGIKNHNLFLDVVQGACVAGLLSFRVVGSKNPIICFKLEIAEEDLNSQVPWELPDLFVALGVS